MPGRKKRSPLDLNANPGFEIELENTLRPVSPDPDFINRLHKRLVTQPDVSYEPGGFNRSQMTLVLVVVLMIALSISVIAAIKKFVDRIIPG